MRAGELSDFEAPELLSVSDETLEQFYRDEPDLQLYRRHFEKLRKKKDHILDPAGEKLLASAGELAQVGENVYGLFQNADLTFPNVLDSKGETYALSQGSYISLLQSEDRVLRQNAYETYYAAYRNYRNTLAATLSGQVKSLAFYTKARNYPSALERSLSRTEVPVSVYENLITVVNENQHLMTRYLSLRKKLLGVDELHFYDLYTPLVSGVDEDIPYETAVNTVKEALRPLGEDYAKVLEKGFSSRWIDVYENQGKRSGAYSAGARIHPYVLLNYTGSLDGQFTIAHEMGHALHSYYSNKCQPVVYSDYVIFVAEVASTCNEALLMEHLLAKTEDKRQRAYLLNHFLEQFRATLYRQTMFAEFEWTLSKLEQAGVPLTADTLCKEYGDLLERYFGNSVVMDENITMEWARIPHFYYDFYVYQYATGYAAAIALSRRILSGEVGAVDDYLRFLSGGCSKDPITLLRDAGVDMSTEEPVRSALQLFEKLLDEMEQLMEEL
jgi:oligoendopeptidase F